MHIMLWQIIIAADSESSFGSENILWIVGIVLASFFMLKITHRRIKNSQRHMDLTVKERMAAKVKVQSDSTNQMTELMASLADLSRQINGQIDTRVAKLELLLDRADKAIDSMNKLANTHSTSVNQKGRSQADSLLNSDLAQHVSQEEGASITGEEFIVPESQSELTEQPITPPQPEMSQEAKYVLDLLESGMSVVSIAKRMGRPIGEIELILSLAGRKG